MLDISYNSVTAAGHKIQIPEYQYPEMARKRAALEKEAEENKNSKVLKKAENQKGFAVRFGEDWSQAFIQNKSLVHVDMSNNKIDIDDCEIIAEGLKQNQSILGIHFSGNAGYVDN